MSLPNSPEWMRRRSLRARPGRAARVRHARAPRLACAAHHACTPTSCTAAPSLPARSLVLSVRVPMIYSCHRRSHRRLSPPYHHCRHQHHRHHRHHHHHCHRHRHHCHHRHLPHCSSAAAAAAHAPGRTTRTLVRASYLLTLPPLSSPPLFAAQVQTRSRPGRVSQPHITTSAVVSASRPTSRRQPRRSPRRSMPNTVRRAPW